jgi:hypothetical protein
VAAEDQAPRRRRHISCTAVPLGGEPPGESAPMPYCNSDFRRHLVIAIVMSATLAGPGCDLATVPPDAANPDLLATADAGPRGDGATGCTGSVTFQNVLTGVLSHCGGPIGCHRSGRLTGGGLLLQDAVAYQNLVGVPSTANPAKQRVVPGDPGASFLMQKLTNTQGPEEGKPMPQGDGIQWQQLPDAQLNELRCWIAAGARND